MAYPVVKYNSSTGSNSSPSDCVNSSANSSQRVTGTGGSTTLTFDSAVDLTGVANDGSDYIWASTNAGERHLFQISAFGGTIASCTSVTVVSALDGDTSNSNWHINGTRQTFEFDSTNSDEKDWEPGWTAELASGTYTHTTSFTPGEGASFNSRLPGIEIRAESGAATRPIISPTGTGADSKRMLGSSANQVVKCVGIEFSGGASSPAFASYIDASTGLFLTLVDCVVDTTAMSSQPNFIMDFQYNNRAFVAIGCYFKGGGTSMLRSNSSLLMKMYNCHFDGDGGTYASTAAIYGATTTQTNVVIVDCLIEGAAGHGISLGSGGQNFSLVCLNNTIVGNGLCGLRIVDEDTISDTSPQKEMQVMNNLSAFNGQFGFLTPSTLANRWQFGQSSIWAGNATFGNTSGAYSGQITSSVSGVTLSVDPFTDRASGDYSLNSTPGGGAECIDAGFPLNLPTP